MSILRSLAASAWPWLPRAGTGWGYRQRAAAAAG